MTDTVEQIIRGPTEKRFREDFLRHDRGGFGEAHAAIWAGDQCDRALNEMNHVEFLRAVSMAIEERFEQEEVKRSLAAYRGDQ